MEQTGSCRREGGRGNGGTKGKGLINKHIWMTHGCGQRTGDWLGEIGGLLGEGVQKGKKL